MTYKIVAMVLGALQSVSPKEALSGAFVPFVGQGVIVMSTGKAAVKMMEVALNQGVTVTRGIIVVKDGHIDDVARTILGDHNIEIIVAAHPIPDARSEAAGRRLLAFAQDVNGGEVLYLMSGGTSSLTAAPVLGVSFEELHGLTASLLQSGATITEMNAVRKALSLISGGKLAREMSEAVIHTFAISDVMSDDPSVIGSGPCVPNSTTHQSALTVLEKYKIDFSQSVRSVLATELPVHDFAHTQDYRVVTSNLTLAKAVEKVLLAQGYEVVMYSDPIEGEAQVEGRRAADIILAGGFEHKRAYLWRGETVVSIDKGCQGRGSRSMEWVLSCALALPEGKGVTIVGLESDGTAASTDAAGAVLTPEAVMVSDAREALKAHDTYPFLKKIEALIITGPTGTNVADIYLVLIK